MLLFHLTSTSSCREVRQNQGKQVRVKVVRNWTEEHPASAEVVTVKLVSYLDALIEKKNCLTTTSRLFAVLVQKVMIKT